MKRTNFNALLNRTSKKLQRMYKARTYINYNENWIEVHMTYKGLADTWFKKRFTKDDLLSIDARSEKEFRRLFNILWLSTPGEVINK